MANRNLSSRVLHRKKFDGGRRTPNEYHAAESFPLDARCAGCGARPVMRAQVFAPFDECSKRGMLPEGALINPAILQAVVQLKGASGQPEPFIRLSVVYSCKMCQKAFEKQCARAPSWCFVDLEFGPDPTNRVVVGAS